jgi:hypothetical protein
VNLVELHGLVKNHPYRINGDDKYLENYKKCLFDLSHLFYEEVKKTKYKNSTNMVHDFNGSISNIGREDFNFDKDTVHVEKCIGTIHEFIDTGKVSSFWTFYRGCNHYELPGPSKYIWDDARNRYFMVKTKEEFDRSIAWLEGKCKNEDSIKWYKPALDWVKENREFWFGDEK